MCALITKKYSQCSIYPEYEHSHYSADWDMRWGYETVYTVHFRWLEKKERTEYRYEEVLAWSMHDEKDFLSEPLTGSVVVAALLLHVTNYHLMART
jgi:hypothetical protein